MKVCLGFRRCLLPRAVLVPSGESSTPVVTSASRVKSALPGFESVRPPMRASLAIPPVVPVAPSLGRRTLFVIGSRPKPAAVLPADWQVRHALGGTRKTAKTLPLAAGVFSSVTDRRTSHLVRYARCPPPRALVFIPRARAREPGRRRASPARSPPSRAARSSGRLVAFLRLAIRSNRRRFPPLTPSPDAITRRRSRTS